jgi:hypothetical protein
MKIAYSGVVSIPTQSPSTSDTTLVVAGGVGISGRLYVAANLGYNSGITTTYGNFRNDSTPTLIVNGTTASTDYLTGL